MNAPRAYYNEIDPFAAEWIRNLIAAGLVMPGDVDERSIVDVRPADLAGYARCHFFAGIAVWDYALGLAGWPADRPVWTGSCPCQPFSAAGRGAGFADERHLWPAWFDLIRQCGPDIVLGEQVEAAVRLGWLDAVFADLEGEGYACGAVVFGAHSVGAPHLRQRLWFVADAGRQRLDGQPAQLWRSGSAGRNALDHVEASGRGEARGLADADRGQRHRVANGEGRLGYGTPAGWQQGDSQPERGSSTCVMAEPARGGPSWRESAARAAGRPCAEAGGASRVVGDASRREQRHRPSEAGVRREIQTRGSGPWGNPDWLPCQDGKARPVEPGTFPLAHGAPARVGRLRAYGNAINAEAAVAFISACREVIP